MSVSPSSICVFGDEPDRLGLELRLREVERKGLDRLAVADALPLVGDDLLGDDDAAEGEVDAEPALFAERLDDRRHRVLLRLRVLVAGVRLDEGGAILQVELGHAVRLAEMEVDGALVDGRVGALLLDEPQE